MSRYRRRRSRKRRAVLRLIEMVVKIMVANVIERAFDV